jgi:hypothetical protein
MVATTAKLCRDRRPRAPQRHGRVALYPQRLQLRRSFSPACRSCQKPTGAVLLHRRRGDRRRRKLCSAPGVTTTLPCSAPSIRLNLTAMEPSKHALANLLSQEHAGIVFNKHYDGDGAVVYKHAFGCEGIVWLGSNYASGRVARLRTPRRRL